MIQHDFILKFLEMSAPLDKTFMYLDPGSGSFILQLLLASIVGAAFAVRMYWKKIKTGILRAMGKAPEENSGDLVESDQEDV